MIAFTLRSLTENTCQGVMSICGATMLISSFQSACVLTATWLHDVPHLAFMQKVTGDTGKIEKPLGNTWNKVLRCRKDSVLWYLGADSSHSQEVGFLSGGIMLVVLALFGYTSTVGGGDSLERKGWEVRKGSEEDPQQEFCYALVPLHSGLVLGFKSLSWAF